MRRLAEAASQHPAIQRSWSRVRDWGRGLTPQTVPRTAMIASAVRMGEADKARERGVDIHGGSRPAVTRKQSRPAARTENPKSEELPRHNTFFTAPKQGAASAWGPGVQRDRRDINTLTPRCSRGNATKRAEHRNMRARAVNAAAGRGISAGPSARTRRYPRDSETMREQFRRSFLSRRAY